MDALKNCKNCNTEFNSTPKLRIYCSKECSDRARKDQVNKYYKEYQKRPEVKEKLNKYQREYQKNPKAKEYRKRWWKEYFSRYGTIWTKILLKDF